MNEMIFKSDADQRHRRWFNCIKIPFEYKYLISGEVEVLAQEQDMVFKSPEPIQFCDEEDGVSMVYGMGLRADSCNNRERNPLAIQFLATYGGDQCDVVIRSYFPVYDEGIEVSVALTAIHPWKNGLEATLTGLVLEGTREIVFYDTRYAQCGRYYRIGETYRFKLAGFAHCAEVLKSTKVQMSPEATEMFCQASGKKLKRDADGAVVPMTVDTKQMVAFVSRGGDYPEDHEFQSTIRGFDETYHRTDKHCVFKIACARGNDGREIEIPLVVNPDLLGRPWPRVGQCLRGILWLQGHCVTGERKGLTPVVE